MISPDHTALHAQATDLRRTAPRSPLAALGNDHPALLARVLDKCRAVLLEQNGPYHYNCGLDRRYFKLTGVDAEALRAFVATGAGDEQVAAWLQSHSRVQEPGEIIAWNNRMRDKRVSELSAEAQAYLEDYIPQVVSNPAQVKVFFDVFDAEEGRL